MTGPVFDLTRVALSMVERDRMAAFLGAIHAMRSAKAAASAEGLSEAAEYLALMALTEAETRLLELTLDPDLGVFLQLILDALAEFVGDRP